MGFQKHRFLGSTHRISWDGAKIRPLTKNHNISVAYINKYLSHKSVDWLDISWSQLGSAGGLCWSWLAQSHLEGQLGLEIWELGSKGVAQLWCVSYLTPGTSMLYWACFLTAIAEVHRSQPNFTRAFLASTTSCLFNIQLSEAKPWLTSEGKSMFFPWKLGGQSE